MAEQLQQAGLATLLIDLLTAEEEIADRFSGHLRFDIQLLAQRLGYVTDWLKQNPSTRALKIGYFGASTGAGATVSRATRATWRTGISSSVISARGPAGFIR